VLEVSLDLLDERVIDLSDLRGAVDLQVPRVK
jgi:hypothetical protein